MVKLKLRAILEKECINRNSGRATQTAVQKCMSSEQRWKRSLNSVRS